MADVEMLTGHLVPAGSMFAFLATPGRGIPGAECADMFDPAVADEFLAAAAGQAGPAAGAASPDSAGSGEPGGDSGKEPLAWYGDSAYGTGDLCGMRSSRPDTPR